MKIVVLGLWHQGCVTAACVARHFNVVGLDFNYPSIENLQRGIAPISEPGLNELIRSGICEGRLRFTTNVRDACTDADVLWVAFDTKVNDNDESDVESVLRDVRRCIVEMPRGALVLLSSQLPVGTCRQLELEFDEDGYRFACAPENLRLGKAIELFERTDRIILGCRDFRSRTELEVLFSRFTNEFVWMSPESAEMTKHAINSFLALSITFMNELARICEATGADAKEVERGLKSESRIGPKAYLAPGGPFAGGTLARDVVIVTSLGEKHGEILDVIPAIKRSNDRHRQWALKKIRKIFFGRSGCRVAILGLTYKPGTNTLRRSSAVELACSLAAEGFEICAYDPSRPDLPSNLEFINLRSSAIEAAKGADVVVVCTEWAEFHTIDWSTLLLCMRDPIVIDASRFVEKQLTVIENRRYITVGFTS